MVLYWGVRRFLPVQRTCRGMAQQHDTFTFIRCCRAVPGYLVPSALGRTPGGALRFTRLSLAVYAAARL